MKTIVKLDLEDIKQIVSNYFNVDIKNVSVKSCGGGCGYYCNMEVEKDD